MIVLTERQMKNSTEMLHAVNSALKTLDPKDSLSASNFLGEAIKRAEARMHDFRDWIKSIQNPRTRSGLNSSGKITHQFEQNEQRFAEFQKIFDHIKSDLNPGLNLTTVLK